MRRIQVHSHGPGRPCPTAIARILAGADAGERLHVVAASRDDAEAIADALRDRGLMGVQLAGSQLEIVPDWLH